MKPQVWRWIVLLLVTAGFFFWTDSIDAKFVFLMCGVFFALRLVDDL